MHINCVIHHCVGSSCVHAVKKLRRFSSTTIFFQSRKTETEDIETRYLIATHSLPFIHFFFRFVCSHYHFPFEQTILAQKVAHHNHPHCITNYFLRSTFSSISLDRIVGKMSEGIGRESSSKYGIHNSSVRSFPNKMNIANSSNLCYILANGFNQQICICLNDAQREPKKKKKIPKVSAESFFLFSFLSISFLL